ncbi:HAD family hydrolase [Rothia endophytica]|uniref:HAD family hydrolase n=1 Tax=Rothia endophytica TaxID=1324766 RepID=UPI001F3C54E6|nr:HAD family hydrolase [Rothia endophytica]
MIAAMKDLEVNPPRRSNWQKEDGVKYLVAIDIDGTLVNHDGAMSEAVKEAAQAVVAAGHHVVISTGRSMGATLPIVNMVGMTRGYAISSNGGVTLEIDPAAQDGHRILDRVCFDPSHAITMIKKRLPEASLALEAPDGTVYATENFEDWSFGANTVKRTRTEMAAMDSAVRVVVSSPTQTPDDFKRAIYDVGLHGVNYAVGWSAWLDIAAHGVSKASALEQIRRRLSVDPRHTVAVGDGYNDKEMIHWAARGVAMGQAPAEIAALATDVTGSVYEDGIVPILRELL